MQVKILFAMTLCVFVIHINAQHVNIPPSPNASSLGSFAAAGPVGFTGEQTVTIPITELKIDQTFTIPISLNYRTGGIKVEQISSNVGLGWSLNAGGVVTRTVQGYPDDIESSDFKGYFKNLSIIQNFDPTDAASSIVSELDDASDDNKDLEPDIFYFNFFGKTGKFLFDENKTIQQISRTNYIIHSLFDQDEELIGFVITDDNGNQYRFEDIETSEVSSVYDERSPLFENADKANYTYNSSWYLTKIITSHGHEVDLTYNEQTINYRKRPVVMADVCKNNDCSAYPNINPNWAAPEYINYEVDGLNLSKISFGKRYIQFNYSNQRQDLQNGSILTSIRKSQDETNSSLIFNDQWSLTHSYFTSSGGTSEIYKRLELTGVNRLSRDNQEIENLYSFEYHGTDLPNRESYEQDFWGFYNGNGASNLIPEIYAYPSLAGTHQEYSIYPIPGVSAYHLFSGANRLPNEIYTKACALKKITYPTKGTQEFVIESNEFLFHNQLKKGPGLRVKTIIKSDETDHSKDFSYHYTYDNPSTSNTSGNIFSLPNHAYNSQRDKIGYLENGKIKIEDGTNKCQYTFINLVPGCLDEGSISWSSFYDHFYKTERFAIDQSALGAWNGIALGYEYITVTNPDGSMITTQYNIEGSYSEWSNYTSGQYASKGDFYVPEIYSIKLGVKTKEANHSYPFPVNSNYDWKRGLPSKVELFISNGQLKQDKIYTYIIRDFGNDVLCLLNRPLKAFDPYALAIKISFPNTTNSSYLKKENRFSLFKVLANISYDVSSITTNHYESNGIVSTSENFTYAADQLYLREESFSSSEGMNTAKRFYYPTDLLQHNITLDDDADSESSALDWMIEKNMLNTPIEEFSLVNGKVTGVQLTTFKSAAGNPVMDKIYTLPLSSPTIFNTNMITSISRVSIGGNDHDYSLVKNSNYKLELSFDQFDNKGNILQMHENHHFDQAFIWGYQQAKLRAKVINAGAEEIFYSGFEDEQFPGDPTANAYKSYSDKYTGNYSLLVKPTKFGFSTFINPDSETDVYTLSAMIKTPSGFTNGGNAGLIIQVLDESDDTQLAWLSTNIGSTNNQWQLVNRKVDLSNYTQAVKLKIEVWNNNTVDNLLVDDVRFHPIDSQMNTFTYEERTGLTSTMDNRRRVKHFEYDNFGRLILTKDTERNILSTTHYNYKQ